MPGRSGPAARSRCDSCYRLIPITRGARDAKPTPRLRRHALVPGGQMPCPGSGRELHVEVVSLAVRSAGLERWCGPRRWEDAGL